MARKGNAGAIERLTPPDYPAAVEYLREWVMQLHGRSGVGMGGLSPLSYTTIADWSRLKRVDVLPHEVEAVIILDSILFSPGSGDSE